MVRPWRFIAMTSMNSSWVISVVPPAGLVQWMPKTLEGPLTGRVDAGQEEHRSQLDAGFADRRTRVSVITERGFQRSRTEAPSYQVKESFEGFATVRKHRDHFH